MYAHRSPVLRFLREFSVLCVVSRGERSSLWNSPPRARLRIRRVLLRPSGPPRPPRRLLLHLQVRDRRGGDRAGGCEHLHSAMSDDDRAWMVRVEAGRLSASDLEHPDLQPLLLPLDKFDGQGSRLPGAVIKNPGGGKQKHWATCWVIDRRAKYAAASGEATAAAEYLRDPHESISTTEHGAFIIHGGRATITRGQKDAGILALESLSAPGATAKQRKAPYEDRAAGHKRAATPGNQEQASACGVLSTLPAAHNRCSPSLTPPPPSPLLAHHRRSCKR